MASNKIPLIAVVGPTASGKTNLSVEIAKIFNGEVVSADSMQIYKYMNIATAKPTTNEMQGIPHHLMDFLDIDKEYSVSEYVNMAKDCILDINNRKKIPIVTGGTGLYIDSLINNINFTESKSDLKLRNKLFAEASEYGGEYLLKKLSEFDVESANRIHPNNIKRIVRAIEIYYTTGITMTEQIKNSKRMESPYNMCYIGLTYKNRDNLYKRINDRVDIMINNGLIEEAEEILKLHCSKTSLNAIGYKELIPFFENKITLEQAIEKIKLESRKYAKRQLTWFRRNKDIMWFYVDSYNSLENLYDSVFNFIENSGII